MTVDLTIEQVADICQCSTKTIMRAIDRGELRAYQVQRRGGWRVEPGALTDWKTLRSNQPRQVAPAPGDAAPIRPPAASPRPTAPRRRGGSRQPPTNGTLSVSPNMGRSAA